MRHAEGVLPARYVRHSEQPRTVDIHLLDGLFIKTVEVARAGTIIPQHSHGFDHVTLLAHGRMRVFRDDIHTGDVTGPIGILILAGCLHRFETLTDGVVFACIHRTDEHGDVPVTDEHQLAGVA